MLTKYASPEVGLEVLDVQRVPANAGHRRLARARRQAHRAAFDYTPRPGYIYVRSRAISSRCNDNFDEFPAEEIKKAYRTFIGKPVFVNHHNADHRRARGVIIDAALHEDTNPDGTPDTWAEVLMEVDAVKFPVLAREVLAGNIARTSMGTDVAYSICTGCGNKAYTPADYCQHIPKMKGMKIRRVNAATGRNEEVLIAERCYGLGFFENSLLVEDPADPTAFVLGVEDGGLDKAAARAVIDEAEGYLREASPKQATLTVDENDLHETRPDPVSVVHHLPRIAFRREDIEEFRPHPNDMAREAVAEREREYMRQQMRLAFPSRRDLADQLEGNQSHGEQIQHPLTPRPRATAPAEPEGEAFPVPQGQGSGLGSAEHIQEGADKSTRQMEWQHRQQWRQYHPGEPYQRTHDEQALFNRTHPHPTVGQRAAAIEKGSEEYKTHYQRGWAASQRGGSMEAADNRGEPDAWYDGYMDHATGRPKWSLMHHPSAEAANAALDAGWTPPRGGRTAGSQTSLQPQRLAYGETKAPAKVDTMRAEACPVCGDNEGFTGEKCNVCGYMQPPDQFRDPDLTKARQVDLRQEQAEDAGVDPGQGVDLNGNPVDAQPDQPDQPGQPGTETLECTNCGEVFSAEGDAATSPDAPDEGVEQDPTQAPETDPEHPDDTENSNLQKADQPDDLSDLADKSDADLGLEEGDEDPDDDQEDEDEEVTPPTAPGEGHVVPEAAEDKIAPVGPDDDEGDDDQPPNPLDGVDGEIAPNMTCPVCGQGTLVPVAAQPAGDEPEPDVAGQAPVQPKKKSLKEASRSMNQPNPAQQRRNRIIEAIREQQGVLQSQAAEIAGLRNAVATLAVAARVGHHPAFASIVRAAGLHTADSAQNPDGAPATTTEEAKKPQATDNVESKGAAPGEVNKDVTPKATTDVQNTNVAGDAPVLDNLQDVTAPVAGTDAPVPDAGNAESASRVTVGNPSNDTFDTKTWAAKQRGGEQERFVASLRLARLQVAAGIETDEDLAVAQRIAQSDQSLAEITAQVTTLAAVASKQASAPNAEQARRLVPRSANRQAGIQSVSLQAQAASTGREGEDEWMIGGVDA